MILAIVTFGVYAQTGWSGFVNLDDDAYVEFQPMVNQGLRSAAIAWAWTATHSNNWHPLTSLSHMLDCSVFGLNPGAMHLENVVVHVLNTVVLFLVWRQATGALWRSAIVAALFALHPAHVESVAWIAERKDVLSTLFWLLGIGAYVRYARHPSPGRFLLVGISLLFGLLAKPMAVTMPLTLLLLDLWPLNRLATMGWQRLVREKIPLIVLAGAHSAITIGVQASTGATNYGHRFSFPARLGNAVVSYLRYLGTGVWPYPLAPHYDHPGWWPWWAVAGSALTLVLITALVWRQRNDSPCLLFGWGWFLVTLLPVIGIVQVGAQAMADRYTYVPFIGLFTAGVWAAGSIAQRFSVTRAPLTAFTLLILGTFAVLSYRQAAAWKDSVTLYRRSIDSGTENATIRYLLGAALQSTGRAESEVAAEYRRAIELSPEYTNAYTQLAMLALNQQDVAEAERLIMESIRLEPGNPALRKNLGVLRNIQGRKGEAAAQFAEALRLDPDYLEAVQELGWMDSEQGRLAEALGRLEKVAKASPWNFAAFGDLGSLYLRLGRREDARRCLQRALWINPNFTPAEGLLQQLE